MSRAALLVCSLAGEGEIFPKAPESDDFALTVAVDAGAEWFRARGVVPGLAVGDFDSVSADTMAWLEAADVEIVRASADKDVSDLDIALGVCENRAIQAAVVLGAVGGRLDHQLAVMGALLHCTIADLRLVCPGQTVRLLRTGGEATIERVGITFSVIAPQEATVSISGARWPLDHTRLGALSSHGLSNECTADTARVTVHSGCAFLIMNSTGSD